MNTRHKDEDTECEHVVVEVGDWSLFISEEDGEPQVNVPDHLNLRIDGDPKDHPMIRAEGCEFPTDLIVTNHPDDPTAPSYRFRLQEGYDHLGASSRAIKRR